MRYAEGMPLGRHASLLILLAAAFGCGEIIGLGDPQLGQGGSAAGAMGGGGATGGEGGIGGGGGSGGAQPTCDGCTGDVLWSRAFGTTGDSSGLVATVVDGDVVFAVATDGDIDFGGGVLAAAGDGVSIAVARLDASGSYVWQRRFSGVGVEMPQAIEALPSGDVILVGYFAQTLDLGGGVASTSGAGDRDGFVARLEGASGALVWQEIVSGIDDQYVRDVAVSSTGRIVAIGDFETEVNIDGDLTSVQGDTDAVVVEFGEDGGALSTRIIASTAADSGQRIAFHSDGEVIVVGDYETTLDIGGVLLPNASQLEIFVAKMDISSGVSWATSLGGNNYQYARGLDVRGARLVVGGGFQSEMRLHDTMLLADYEAQQYLAVANADDGSAVSLAAQGQISNADRDERVIAPKLDGAGHIVAAGWFEGLATIASETYVSVEGSKDLIVVKTADDGTVFWSHSFGDGGLDQAHDVVIDDVQTVIVGTFAGDITMEQTHTCVAATCVVVARLAK
jgi:hypothetical protein